MDSKKIQYALGAAAVVGIGSYLLLRKNANAASLPAAQPSAPLPGPNPAMQSPPSSAQPTPPPAQPAASGLLPNDLTDRAAFDDAWMARIHGFVKSKLDAIHAPELSSPSSDPVMDLFWRASRYIQSRVPSFSPSPSVDNAHQWQIFAQQLNTLVPSAAGIVYDANGNAQPSIVDSPAFQLLAMASVGISAYHGYRRTGSIGWAIGWGIMGGIAPVITPAIAFAQGFGKPEHHARNNPSKPKRKKSAQDDLLRSERNRLAWYSSSPERKREEARLIKDRERRIANGYDR